MSCHTTIEVPEDEVFGPNFKIRCWHCMEQSGWMTLNQSTAWWRFHQHDFPGHLRMVKFIKKVPGLRVY